MLVRDHEIGGGVVRRGFNVGGEYLRAGAPLTRAEVLAIRNRQALIDNRQLDVYPPGTPSLDGGKPAGERFIAYAGFGRYHVYEGRRLTAGKGVTKAEAEALSGAVAGGEGDEEPKPPIEEPPPKN